MYIKIIAWILLLMNVLQLILLIVKLVAPMALYVPNAISQVDI